MYNALKKTYIRLQSFIVAILVYISPYLATKYLYWRRTGKKLNLSTPKNFNEKINWLKLYWNNSFVSSCGDKYEVRNYVHDLNLSHILNELHGVYEDASEIKWEELPNRFVFKVTNGCGFNIVCNNKHNLNKKEVEHKLNKWLNTKYSLKFAEIHYDKMKPRIICERFMETEDGSLPIDYKIFCFSGMPKYILVVKERESRVKRFMFDIEWNQIDFMKSNSNDELEVPKQPKSFGNMITYARQLSNPFPFVRVDFYDYYGKAILGEMTFTPDAGLATHYKDSFLNHLGEMIELPDTSR